MDLKEENDAAIHTHGLENYMVLCSDRNKNGSRRLNGLRYPDPSEPWMPGSLMEYEKVIFLSLQERGYPPAVFDRPQELTIQFKTSYVTYPQQRIFDKNLGLLRKQINQLLAVNELGQWNQKSSSGNTTEEYFVGNDVDAMHTALKPVIDVAIGLGAHTVIKRYGDRGARQITVPLIEP